MNNYQYTIIYKEDGKLIGQWNALWKRSENATLFNSYEWFKTCVETYKLQDYELHLCYKNGKLAAVLPLTDYNHFGIKVSGTLCNNVLVDTSFLVEKYDKKLFTYFFGNIIKKRNIFLNKINEKDAKFLYKLFPDMFVSLMAVNPYIDFTKDPLSYISKSTSGQVRRIMKKNNNQLQFKTFDHTDDLRKQLEVIFKLEQKSTKKEKSKDLFSDKKNKVFYRNLVKYCGKYLTISFVYYNNNPVVYSFNFVYKDTFIGHQTSFLPEYRNLRPGKIMLYHLIESLQKSHYKILDMGGGINTFKQEFTPFYRFHYNVSYSKSLITMLWWKLINTAGRTKKILKPEKHSRDHVYLFKKMI